MNLTIALFYGTLSAAAFGFAALHARCGGDLSRAHFGGALFASWALFNVALEISDPLIPAAADAVFLMACVHMMDRRPRRWVAIMGALFYCQIVEHLRYALADDFSHAASYSHALILNVFFVAQLAIISEAGMRDVAQDIRAGVLRYFQRGRSGGAAASHRDNAARPE